MKMRSPMMWISALALTAVLSGGNSAFAQNEGSVLFVAPHRVLIDGQEQGEVITVTNKSDRQRRYDLELVDQAMGEDGITKRVETFDYSIKRMTKFVPKRFTVEPGKTQTVRLQVTRPKDLADGDYHSHLLFREVPLSVKDKQTLQEERAEADQTVNFEIRTLYGIAVPVIVQQGAVNGDLAMADPVLGKSPEGQPSLRISFTRSGNSEAAGKVSASYVANGKEPVPVLDSQWVRLYRETGTVTKDFPLANLPADAKGGKIVVKMERDEEDPSKTDTKEIPFN